MTEKQRAAAERRRLKGHREYIRRLRREKAKKKKAEEKKKERERIRLQKEREKLKKKRPVGRPKKRGPKRKRKKKAQNKVSKPVGRPYMGQYIYKIVSCRNGKQNKFIGKYRTIEEAYEVLNALKREDENIILPILLTGEDKLFNSIDEYILIEKTDGKSTSLLRNEYGKLVEHKVDKNGWVIIDKYRYKREETFWVYGYCNKSDRKTFIWIYENLIISNIETHFDFKRIMIYKNKLIIKDDSESINMVICKNESDSIRLYNKIEEYIRRDKIKQVLFIGNYSQISEKRKSLEKEIMELTNWPIRKVQMKTTKYHLK